MIAEERFTGNGGARTGDRSYIYSLTDGSSVYILFIVSILMIVSGLLLLIFFFSGGEKVREIQISGLKYLQESDVLEALAVKKDHPMAREEIEKSSERLRELPAVEAVNLKLLAGTLMVDVIERPCVAVLRSGDSLYDFFSDMSVISSGTIGCHGVPLITGNFTFVDGFVKSEELKRTIAGLSLMNSEKPELAHRISEIRFDSKKTSVIYLSDPHLRIEYTGDLNLSLINRMYAAVSYYEKENKSAGWIDLTGKDAILVPGK